jgi:hypothetical protein
MEIMDDMSFQRRMKLCCENSKKIRMQLIELGPRIEFVRKNLKPKQWARQAIVNEKRADLMRKLRHIMAPVAADEMIEFTSIKPGTKIYHYPSGRPFQPLGERMRQCTH